MKFRSIKSRLAIWRLHKKKSKVEDVDTSTLEEVSDCVSEIGDAVQYYLSNPEKLTYDVAYELTLEDIIFPVGTEASV